MRNCCWALLVLFAGLSPLRGQTADAETIIYLRLLQTRDGAFLPARGEEKPTLRATSGAVRALKYLGSKPENPEGCVKFVAGCFDKKSGGFTDRPGEGKPDVFTTSVGLMAVVELKMPVEEYVGPATAFLERNAKGFEEVRIAAAGFEAVGKLPEKADEWKKLLAGMKNADGTFGKGDDLARATGGAVAAQLRLGDRVEKPETVVKALQGGQRADGGYGKEGAKSSDLETTYRVVRTFVMLKETPDVKKLLDFVESCRASGGGYGVTPGAKPTVAGTYYAAILRHWLEKK
jgi:prenyltransferase beta subunit